MSRWHQVRQPPRALQNAELDNIALVPTSLLPDKARYQALANDLPRGDVLLVLPRSTPKERQLLATAAHLLQAKGHHVTTLPATAITQDAAR